MEFFIECREDGLEPVLEVMVRERDFMSPLDAIGAQFIEPAIGGFRDHCRIFDVFSVIEEEMFLQ